MITKYKLPQQRWEKNEGLEREESFIDQRYYGGGGQTSSDSSSVFSRKGTTGQEQSFNVPGFLSSLLTSSAQESTAGQALSDNQNCFLDGLVSTPPNGSIPNLKALDPAIGLDPTGFDGRTSLQGIAEINPYSSAYETSTQQAFQDRAAQAIAQSQTGPDAVRGGTGRAALAEAESANLVTRDRGEELRKHQTQDAGLVMNASKTLNDIEMQRLGLITGAQDTKAKQYAQSDATRVSGSQAIDSKRSTNATNIGQSMKFLGSQKSQTTEDISGVGDQSGSSSGWSSGVTCCFIFLESLNGKLPWYVRKARDTYVTNNSRKGYNRMSKYIVPLMRKSKVVRWLTNVSIVKPLLVHGRAMYVDTGFFASLKFLLTLPVFLFWRAVWTLIGSIVGETEVSNG